MYISVILIIFIVCFLMQLYPLYHSCNIIVPLFHTFCTTFLSFLLIFSPLLLHLLSIFSPFSSLFSYEVLFYVSFSLNVVLWIALEIRLSSLDPLSINTSDPSIDPSINSPPTLPQRTLKSSDVRAAFLFLFYVNVAFFGTGNVASIASFTVSSVYRLVTIFNPFLMGSLLLLKIALPFFLLSAVLGVLCSFIGLPTTSLFLLILSMTDVLTMNFFFLVRDEGSWLEIGMSISHFIIASGFIVLLTVLFYISSALLGVVMTPKSGQDKKEL